jgi:hypothetical protein
VKLGDYNFDGFPDILVTFYDKLNNKTFGELLESLECTEEDCGKLYLTQRNYKLDGVNSFDLIKQYKSISASFFDISENGKIDILLNIYNSDTRTFEIKAFYNYIGSDAFFIKTLSKFLNKVNSIEWRNLQSRKFKLQLLRSLHLMRSYYFGRRKKGFFCSPAKLIC